MVDFISRLKNLAAKCQFRDNAEVEDRVLDQLIWGSCNGDIQRSLISRDKSLTLAVAIEIGATRQQVNSKSHEEDRSINAIRKEQEREFCHNCGKQHPRGKCPAYGTSCQKCGKANHWQSACHSSKRKQFNQGANPVFKRSIHAIEDMGDDNEFLTISTIQVDAMKDMRNSRRDPLKEAFVTLEIIHPERKRKINLQCKVDTGAQSNVLPIMLLRIIAPGKFDDKGNLKSAALEQNGAVLSAYGGFIIKQLGTINIPWKYKVRKINCIFYVRHFRASHSRSKSVHCTESSFLQCTLNSFNAPAQNSGTNGKGLN